MSKDKPVTTPYPQWICSPCGERYGKRACGIATFHAGKCDICGCETFVTEPRDFGHLKEDWKWQTNREIMREG